MNMYSSSKSESSRIRKLKSFEILDTAPEEYFDRLSNLARVLFKTPYSYISFIDENQVFLKSNLSPLKEIKHPRHNSFCSETLSQNKITILNSIGPNTYPGNPFLSLAEPIKFYAGYPLKSKEGYLIGTISILDTQTRSFASEELETLGDLASLVMEFLNQRLVMRNAFNLNQLFTNRITHDLKNPNTSITLSAEIIKRKYADEYIVKQYAERIIQSVQQSVNRIEYLNELPNMDKDGAKLNFTETSLEQVVLEAIEHCKLQAISKNQKIVFENKPTRPISIDAEKIQQGIEVVLQNAITYSDTERDIHITMNEKDAGILIKIVDHGPGLTEEELAKLYLKFKPLSPTPTSKETTSGLGLSLLKIIVDLHKGKTWATSEGKNKGTTFFIHLPY